MQYYVNQSMDPYENLALEEYLFTHRKDGDILMLWQDRPAVVCGCYQNLFAEVNVPLAQESHVALVRRISGGGTVYHDEGNLNYTMITDLDPARMGYERFLQPVAGALGRIGVPAYPNRTCDLAVDGKKISGSAQKAAGGRVLHHGTLLFSTNLQKLRALTAGQREHFTAGRAIRSAPWPVTNISDHLPKPMTLPAFRDALLEQLAGNGAGELTLTPQEKEEIRALADEKYRRWEWNFGRSPAFVFERELEWQGEKIQVRYRAEKGILREIGFFPDRTAFRAAGGALAGARLDVGEIREKLAEAGGPAELYRLLF